MSINIKILGEISCPRCNGKAQERIDVQQPKGNWFFVYIVCPVCHLSRFSRLSTRKDIILASRVKKFKKNEVNRKISKRYVGIIKNSK
jgi:hypothetical protein